MKTDIPVIQPEDRYIAIVGESWAEMLGTESAKYLTPKVGIFLHGENSDLREAASRMQVISGNAEMAMLPLTQILDALIHRIKASAPNNKQYKAALISMELAREHIIRANVQLHIRPTQ